jgi:hypothetical protein
MLSRTKYTTEILAVESPIVSHLDTLQAGCNDIDPEVSTEDRG